MYYYNNILRNSNANLICHQTNCQGKMNSGVAKAIRDKWFNVYQAYLTAYEYGEVNLGTVIPARITRTQWIMNMCAQDKYGYDGKIYTNYEALQKCLNKVCVMCTFLKDFYEITPTIAFPYKMSCCRGGGNWDIVLDMIDKTFVDYNVEIWRLDND